MEDLLQSQIQDSCRLALPNGLKELMNDISREVLRAQPKNLLKFITDYLSTLLVTRENLHIAAQICSAVCACDCRPELEDELRLSGLDETLVNDVAEIIHKHIEEGEVNEGNLLVKLISKTSIEESHLPAVLAAVRNAFLCHQRKHTKIYESSSSSGDNESERAVRHTLGLYRKFEPSLETYNCMAKKIQAAYRAYRVRRETDTAKKTKTDQLSTTPSLSESKAGQEEGTPEVKSEILEKTKVTFGSIERSTSDRSLDTCSDQSFRQSKTDAAAMLKMSSTSLEGSHLSLRKYRAYSEHDFDTLEETPEKERSNYDYTRENIPLDESYTNKDSKDDRKDKNILFELPDEELSDEYESIEEADSIDADDVSTEPEEELVATDVDVIDVIEENIPELYLVPTTEVEKSKSVLEPDEVDENIVMGIMIEDNVNKLDIVKKVQSALKLDEVDENIEEAGIITEDNVNGLQDIVEKVQSILKTDEVDENIEEAGIMTEENVNLLDIVEEVQSALKPDEVDENIEKAGIITEDNVNGLQGIVEKVQSILKTDEVDENIEEAGIMTEENVNLLDIVEEVQSALKPDEVDENIEKAVIMTEDNVNGLQDIVEEVQSALKMDEVDENIEETGIVTEDNVNLLNIVEENIVINEVGDITDDDIPKEDINGSY